MKHCTNASTALLGNNVPDKFTTFRHLLSVLSNDSVIKKAATSGLQRVHHDLSQDAQSAVIAGSPDYNMDTEIPKEMHLRFEEFVVCFNDKNSNLKLSMYPN